tara:strand:- start:78 stop:317 length:240 start_codon:yes stop_codon:yes gene_type:complete
MNLDFGVIELILMLGMAVGGYLWKAQASEVRQTALDLNKLSIKFAEAKGSAEATNKTVFAHIEEIKEAIARMENLLLNK